jgi:hypothetical protein
MKNKIDITPNWNAEIEDDHLKFTYQDSTSKAVESSAFDLDMESISTSVSGEYWVDGVLYDRDHHALFELPGWVAERVLFYFNYYDKDKDLILTHLHGDVYISAKTRQNVILISEKKQVLFQPFKYKDSIEVCPTCEMIYLDDIVFEDLQIIEELLQRLRELETIDEMKRLILKELSMNVI